MRVAVLGAGFTGAAIAAELARAGHAVDLWSRRSAPGARRVDVSKRPEIIRLTAGPSPDAVVATMPPSAADPALWGALSAWSRFVVLLGTTSSYRRDQGAVIGAGTPLVEDHPRAGAEREVLGAGGAVIRLAGLYGPGRNPLRWLSSGRVGAEPRQVNLVHSSDVAKAILGVLEADLRGAWPLADGQRHTLADIAALGAELGHLPAAPPAPLTRADVEIDASALLAATGLVPLDWRAAIAALSAP